MSSSSGTAGGVGQSLIATAIGTAIGLLVAYLLHVPGIISIWTAITAAIIFVVGIVFSSWKAARLTIQSYALGLFALLLVSGFIIFKQTTRDQVCNQVHINAEQSKVAVKVPARDKDSDFVPVTYKITAPATTGVTVLLHTAAFLQGDGNSQSLGGEGRNTDQYGLHAIAGQELLITNDGISVPYAVVEAATQNNTALIVERKTFHLISDDNVFCKVPAEVRVELKP